MSATDCLVATADADLLGLGVRIGSYLTSLSAIVNLKLDAEDAPGNAWMAAFTAVPITVFAFKYLLQRTISNGMFLAAAYIGWSQLLIFPSVLLQPSICCFKLLAAVLYAAIWWTVGMLLWFWAKGYTRVEQPQCWETQAFFFAQVPAFGWFRWVNVVGLALVALLYLVLLALLFSPAALRRASQAYNRPLRLGIALVVALVFCILGCELTLYWNDIPTDVNSLNSTGQMIALLVGAAAVTRDAYFAWARSRPCPAPGGGFGVPHGAGGGFGVPHGAGGVGGVGGVPHGALASGGADGGWATPAGMAAKNV